MINDNILRMAEPILYETGSGVVGIVQQGDAGSDKANSYVKLVIEEEVCPGSTNSYD